MQSHTTTNPHLRLAQLLGRAPVPAAQIPELAAILEALYTPEEAALAAGLSFKPAPLGQIAQEAGRDQEEMGQALASMAARGLLYERQTPKGAYYSVLPLVPGLVEVQFMAGEVSPAKVRLARLFEDYYAPGVGRAMTQAATPYSRVIPVARAVRGQQEILPFEQAEALLREQKHLAIANCYCRHEADLLGQGCGKPKDVCLTFGSFAEFAVNKGFAQAATLADAIGALERSELAGLVHVTDNVMSGANFICNCCGCCCLFLKTITKLKAPGAVAPAAFLAHIDPDQCSACGECLEICQVKAPAPDEETYIVNPSLCLGCGLCQQVCPTGAIVMQRRQTPATPPDFAALQTALGRNIPHPGA